jgi:hypothetical protein
MKLDELINILETFGVGDFTQAVSKAKQLAQANGSLIIRHGKSPVQAEKLRDTYATRASSPYIRAGLSRQCERLAQVAAQFSHELWYIHTIGENGQITIFANEDGIGRACLDFEVK